MVCDFVLVKLQVYHIVKKHYIVVDVKIQELLESQRGVDLGFYCVKISSFWKVAQETNKSGKRFFTNNLAIFEGDVLGI